MLTVRGKFSLDHLEQIRADKKIGTSPVSEGLKISVKYDDTEYIKIAEVLWSDEYDNCYIKTVGDNFQTHVVLYDDFKDFIYMVDEAFFLINTVHSKKPENPFRN